MISPGSSFDESDPSGDRRPTPPKFYVDTSLGSRAIPELVRELGYVAVTKSAQFGRRRVEDSEWIVWCGAQGYVALTKDDMIRRRAEETSALLAAGLTVFCLTNGNLTKDEQVARFRRHWPLIITECVEAGPKMVGVYANGIRRLPLG